MEIYTLSQPLLNAQEAFAALFKTGKYRTTR